MPAEEQQALVVVVALVLLLIFGRPGGSNQTMVVNIEKKKKKKKRHKRTAENEKTSNDSFADRALKLPWFQLLLWLAILLVLWQSGLGGHLLRLIKV